MDGKIQDILEKLNNNNTIATSIVESKLRIKILRTGKPNWNLYLKDKNFYEEVFPDLPDEDTWMIEEIIVGKKKFFIISEWNQGFEYIFNSKRRYLGNDIDNSSLENITISKWLGHIEPDKDMEPPDYQIDSEVRKGNKIYIVNIPDVYF